MKLKRAKYIYQVFEDIEAEEPGISTEQLMARTADRAGCDYEDVVEALELIQTDVGTVDT
jgi:hypothetical protein